MVMSICTFAEDQGYVILGRRSNSGNWYYLTSVNANTEYTPHLEAVNSQQKDMTQLNTSDLEEKFIWYMEEVDDKILLRNQDEYISYFGLNTMGMSDTGQILSILYVSNGLVNFWFTDDQNRTRYLSLNTTHDYFSFYAGTQAQDLLVLEYGEISQQDCKSAPYSETFASSIGDFTVYNAVLPSGFSSIWNWDSQYGMVAKCIKGSTKYESESYLISPCIEIPMDGQTDLSFRHAAKFFENTSQMTLWISTDYDATNPSAANWTQLIIPTYPTGQNWNWFNSGQIDLSGYKGQYVNIAFKYTSTTSYAPQWEIKDFKVEHKTTDIENIQINNASPTKFLHNGQILILRGDKTYTLTGQEIK